MLITPSTLTNCVHNTLSEIRCGYLNRPVIFRIVEQLNWTIYVLVAVLFLKLILNDAGPGLLTNDVNLDIVSIKHSITKLNI